MKKLICLAIVFMGVFVSCKKEKIVELVVPEKDTIGIPVAEECYLGVLKKDTVLLTLSIKSNQLVSGNLSYKFFEKDKNEGSLIGQMKGDTLFADYTFSSEGVSSVRQVVFLKKENTFIEGYGESVESNGKMIFKDSKQLKFDSKMVLIKTECKH